MRCSVLSALLVGLLASGCSSGSQRSISSDPPPGSASKSPGGSSDDTTWSLQLPSTPGQDRPVYDLEVLPPLFESRSVSQPRDPTATMATFAAETGFRGDRWLLIRTELLDGDAVKEFQPRQMQGTNIVVNELDAVSRVDADGWQRVTFGPLDGHRVDLMSAGLDEQQLLDIAASMRIGDSTAAVGTALAAADLHLRDVRPTEFDLIGPLGATCYDPTSAAVDYRVGDSFLFITTCYAIDSEIAALMELGCSEPRSITIEAGVAGWLCPGSVQFGASTIMWREADAVITIQSDLGDDETLGLAGSVVARRG
jgi:hypothetical protein